MLPQGQPKNNDVIDMLLEACQVFDETPDESGVPRHQIIVDAKKMWYKTQLINAPTFGRFALKLEEFGNMASDAFDNMTSERAIKIAEQISSIVKGYMYSIDAKSSETLRDRNNSQSSLIHLVGRNRAERAITLKDETQKSLMSGFMGKRQQEDAMYD